MSSSSPSLFAYELNPLPLFTKICSRGRLGDDPAGDADEEEDEADTAVIPVTSRNLHVEAHIPNPQTRKRARLVPRYCCPNCSWVIDQEPTKY